VRPWEAEVVAQTRSDRAIMFCLSAVGLGPESSRFFFSPQTLTNNDTSSITMNLGNTSLFRGSFGGAAGNQNGSFTYNVPEILHLAIGAECWACPVVSRRLVSFSALRLPLAAIRLR
jgi:hypothetical protein